MSETITRDSLVVGTLPRIGPARFREVLEAAGSPAAGEAEASWRAVAQQGIDPLFALAVFRHESGYGKLGICAAYDTRNPGNTRSSRTGIGTVIDTERGPFVRYPSWAEGFRDLAYRLVDPEYVYAGRQLQTIGEIIPVWAPAADGNVPESYIRGVVQTMETLREDLLGVPFRVALIPKGNRNRPGYPMRPEWVTVHETGNPNVGANAEMHRRFVHGGGGSEGVSFHFVVDDREVIQLLPLTENGWHAGDGANGPGNRTSIAIETCVNADGDWEATLGNLAALVVALCRSYGWGVDRVVQHNRWSGKDCPMRLRHEGRWEWLLGEVSRLMGGTGHEDARYFPETGHWLAHGFKRYWEEYGGLAVFGYPISEEFTDPATGLTVQYFERARFEHHPGKWPERYDVLLGRVGAELAERLGLMETEPFRRR